MTTISFEQLQKFTTRKLPKGYVTINSDGTMDIKNSHNHIMKPKKDTQTYYIDKQYIGSKDDIRGLINQYQAQQDVQRMYDEFNIWNQDDDYEDIDLFDVDQYYQDKLYSEFNIWNQDDEDIDLLDVTEILEKYEDNIDPTETVYQDDIVYVNIDNRREIPEDLWDGKEVMCEITAESINQHHDGIQMFKPITLSKGMDQKSIYDQAFKKYVLPKYKHLTGGWTIDVAPDDIDVAYTAQGFKVVPVDKSFMITHGDIFNETYKTFDDEPVNEQQLSHVYRNVKFNNTYTKVYHNMSQYKNYMFNSLEHTDLCYEPIFHDAKQNIPDREHAPNINQLRSFITDNPNLNYYIYEQDNIIPKINQFQRQLLFDDKHEHVYVSQKGQNLFFQRQQIDKKIKDNPTIIKRYNQKKEILNILQENLYLYDKIIPYYDTNLMYYADNNGQYYALYTYQNPEERQHELIDDFQRNSMLFNYNHFHELLWKTTKQININDLETIDMKLCYSHILDQNSMPTLYNISEICSYKGEKLKDSNYYSFIIDTQNDTSTIQYQFFYNCSPMKGINLKKLMKKYPDFKITITEYVVPDMGYKNEFCMKKYFTQSVLNDESLRREVKQYINSTIGKFIMKPCDELPYMIYDLPPIYVQQRHHYQIHNHSFVHCQLINQKLYTLLKCLPDLDSIVQMHTDCFTYIKSKVPNYNWITQKYLNGDQMFKQETYNPNLNTTQEYEINTFNNMTLINALPGSGKTTFIKQQLQNFVEQKQKYKQDRTNNIFAEDKVLVIVNTKINAQQYKDFPLNCVDVRCCQKLDFDKNYSQIKNYKHIYVDEVYIMDSQIIKQIFNQTFADSQHIIPITFVGDKFQQCNLNCNASQYDFLNQIPNKYNLTNNHRNNIDYSQFFINGQLSVDSLKNFITKNNLWFSPDQEQFDQDTIYITLSNETMLKINKLYTGNNIMRNDIERKNQKVYRLNDFTYLEIKDYNGSKRIFDGKHYVENYYGNAITCYKCQGQQYRKILIDKSLKEPEQLFVAISRIHTK